MREGVRGGSKAPSRVQRALASQNWLAVCEKLSEHEGIVAREAVRMAEHESIGCLYVRSRSERSETPFKSWQRTSQNWLAVDARSCLSMKASLREKL